MKVKNVNGSPLQKLRGNWLTYWERISGQIACMCFSEGCINTPIFGVHVQKDSPTDQRWYVIPLCKDCSRKNGQALEIWDVPTLVPAPTTRDSSVPEPSFPFAGPRLAPGHEQLER
jgi:hypothetical protein